MATTRLIVRRGKPLHNKINNLKTEVMTFVFDIYPELSKQNGWIIDKSFIMMHFSANLLLMCIG